MTDREEMISLLKEAWEELERTETDRCECDKSVGLQCYPCRLYTALRRYDQEWNPDYQGLLV